MSNSPGKAYKFDETQPPLMKNVGRDVRGIPAADLSQDVGTATWKTRISGVGPLPANLTISGFEPRPLPWTIDNTFVMTRRLRWTISQSIIHLAEPESLKVITATGYNLTQQHSMQKTLGVEVGGKGDIAGLGLSASVKESLSITDTTTQSWSEQTTTETNQTFQGSTTYVTWSLIDSLKVHKTSVGQYWGGEGNRTPVGGPRTTESDDTIDCVVTVWQDKLPD